MKSFRYPWLVSLIVPSLLSSGCLTFQKGDSLVSDPEVVRLATISTAVLASRSSDIRKKLTEEVLVGIERVIADSVFPALDAGTVAEATNALVTGMMTQMNDVLIANDKVELAIIMDSAVRIFLSRVRLKGDPSRVLSEKQKAVLTAFCEGILTGIKLIRARN